MATPEPREWTAEDIARERAREAQELAAGRCPWSGLHLVRTEMSDGDLFACGVCDCFGYRHKDLNR